MLVTIVSVFFESQVGFPMIVKPLAGAGSQGVYIARDKDQLVSTYGQLEGEVKANKFLAYVYCYFFFICFTLYKNVGVVTPKFKRVMVSARLIYSVM